MRVWIDLTNSPHVLVMRPLIERLQREGHEVEVTARDFAQTLGLLERFRIAHTAIGRHRGGGLVAKAGGIASRSGALLRWARRRERFDIAFGHGSNDVSVAAAILRVPSSTMFDYEWASVQHHVNCRLATAVVVPDAIPPERLRRYGADGKVQAYRGLKEEYYLADFEPEGRLLDELRLDRARPIVTVRTPPEVSLYHRFESDLFGAVVHRLADAAKEIQVVVLPRTAGQRAALRSMDGLIVPDAAIDAQSLIAFSDLVVSGGGTMNREAVALGAPVCSTFAGRLGAVDERLIAEGRLRLLTDARELDLALSPRARAGAPAALASESHRPAGAGSPDRVRRDPRELLALLLSPLRAAAPQRSP
ncbi:MAG: DUF354 domain-containing protein [Solirubrobacteraceae bacterium]